jgi:hypothetical protein
MAAGLTLNPTTESRLMSNVTSCGPVALDDFTIKLSFFHVFEIGDQKFHESGY